MIKVIKTVLDKLEDKGYEAYIVGGYVRDLLVGILSYDVDICTNATPKDLLSIFPNASSKNLGGIDFKIKEYHFEITTYRKEIKYENRKPVEFVYINNLVEDLNRRDFTINSICMNKNGDVIDLLNGEEDLNNLIVRMIGDPFDKTKEDPLRILRAVRFATILNFKLEESLYDAIKKNSKLVLTLSSSRIKAELDKILLSNNVLYGLKMLDDLGISSFLNINDSNITPVKSLEGMYSQFPDLNLTFTKEEKKNISIIRKIIIYGNVDNKILYNNGLYLSLIAGEILNINKKTINKMYNNLPIHERSDIDIKVEDLLNIGILKNEISKTLNFIEEKILKGEINNKKEEIMKFLKKR